MHAHRIIAIAIHGQRRPLSWHPPTCIAIRRATCDETILGSMTRSLAFDRFADVRVGMRMRVILIVRYSCTYRCLMWVRRWDLGSRWCLLGDLQDRTAVDLDGHGERCEVRASSFAFVSRFDARGSYLIFVFSPAGALACSRALVVGGEGVRPLWPLSRPLWRSS